MTKSFTLQQQLLSSYFMNTNPDAQEHLVHHVHATFEAGGINRKKRRATRLMLAGQHSAVPSGTRYVLCVMSTAPGAGTWTSEQQALTHTY